MKFEFLLTVAQSKRLIAKGVFGHHFVKAAFNNGTIVICRGTTCTYVAEEFLGHKIEPFNYTTGVTIPQTPSRTPETPVKKQNDIIIHRGEVHSSGETVLEAVKNLDAGDVIIKGANALNYEKRIAGCLIGHPAGGTTGGFWGPLYGKKLRLIIPVGLEKEIGFDIMKVSAYSLEENSGNTLMPVTGTIITEIEAIKILCGVDAIQIGSGGVRGAEGSVRLLASGNNEQIAGLKKLLGEIEDEPDF